MAKISQIICAATLSAWGLVSTVSADVRPSEADAQTVVSRAKRLGFAKHVQRGVDAYVSVLHLGDAFANAKGTPFHDWLSKHAQSEVAVAVQGGSARRLQLTQRMLMSLVRKPMTKFWSGGLNQMSELLDGNDTAADTWFHSLAQGQQLFELAGKLKGDDLIPELLLAVKLGEESNAGEELEQILQLVAAEFAKSQHCFSEKKELKVGGTTFRGVTLSLSSEVALEVLLGVEAEQLRKLDALLEGIFPKGLQVHVLTGLVDGYQVVWLGNNVEKFQLAGTVGESIVNSSIMDKAAPDRGLKPLTVVLARKELLELANHGVGLAPMARWSADAAKQSKYAKSKVLVDNLDKAAELTKGLLSHQVSDFAGYGYVTLGGLSAHWQGGVKTGWLDYAAEVKALPAGGEELLRVSMATSSKATEQFHKYVESSGTLLEFYWRKVLEEVVGDLDGEMDQEIRETLEGMTTAVKKAWGGYRQGVVKGVGNAWDVSFDLKQRDSKHVPVFTIAKPVKDRAQLKEGGKKLAEGLQLFDAQVNLMGGFANLGMHYTHEKVGGVDFYHQREKGLREVDPEFGLLGVGDGMLAFPHSFALGQKELMFGTDREAMKLKLSAEEGGKTRGIHIAFNLQKLFAKGGWIDQRVDRFAADLEISKEDALVALREKPLFGLLASCKGVKSGVIAIQEVDGEVQGTLTAKVNLYNVKKGAAK